MLNLNYILVWCGQLVSQLGNRIYLMALSWYFVSVLDDPGGLFILFVISSLPSLLFGLFVGPFVDRWKKKNIIVVCDIISAILTAILAFMVYYNRANQPIIYCICFLLNTVNLFFSPSVNSILPSIINKKDYQKGMSYLKMITFLGQILGAAVGGVLVGFCGAFITILINSISFLSSALFESFIRYKETIVEKKRNYLGDMKDGLRYIMNSWLKMRIIIASICANLFVPVIVVTVPIIINNDLKLSATYYGIADAMLPIGAVTMALLLSRMHNVIKPLKIFSISVGVISLCYLSVSLFENYYVLLLALFTYGAMTNFLNIQTVTWLLHTVEPEYRGRFFSLFESMSYASISMSYVISVVVIKNFEVTTSLAINAAGLMVCVCLALIWFNKQKKLNITQ